jgi:hypothetical protein
MRASSRAAEAKLKECGGREIEQKFLLTETSRSVEYAPPNEPTENASRIKKKALDSS